MLDNQSKGGEPTGGGGGAATAHKGADAGGDGADAEGAKLKAGLASTFNMEKPNVKWSDVAGLEGGRAARRARRRRRAPAPSRALRATLARSARRRRQGRAEGGGDPAVQVSAAVHGQAQAVEGHPAVRAAGHGQELPGQGRGHRGGVRLLFHFVVGPRVQVAGREREARQGPVRPRARKAAEHCLHRRNRLAVRRARRGQRVRVVAPHQDRVPRADAGRGQGQRRHAHPRRHQHAVGNRPGHAPPLRKAHLHPAARHERAPDHVQNPHRRHVVVHRAAAARPRRADGRVRAAMRARARARRAALRLPPCRRRRSPCSIAARPARTFR